jgi:hypothetical protein
MAIQTAGFNIAKPTGVQFNPATPTPLSFVDGSTLQRAADIPSSADVGLNNYAENSTAATRNLLAGVTVGLSGILGGIERADERDYKEEQAELDHERDMELAQYRVALADATMSPLQEEQLTSRRLGNAILRKKIRDQEQYDAYYGNGGGNPDSSDVVINGDGNVDIPLADVPLPGQDGQVPEPPLPTDGGVNAAPEPTTKADGLTAVIPPTDSGGGPFRVGSLVVTPIPESEGGGRVIFDTATKKSYFDKSTSPDGSPLGGVPPEGMSVKGVTVNAKGEATTRYEPTTSTAEGAMTPEQEKQLAKLRAAVKSDTLASLAIDAVGSHPVVTSALALQTGAGDITAINAFQRMVDPGVAVREGDVALLQKAIPGFDRWWLKVQNLAVGDQLTPEVRKQLQKGADTILAARLKAGKANLDNFKKQAQDSGIDPKTLIPDFELPPSLQHIDEANQLKRELDMMNPSSEGYKAKRDRLKQLMIQGVRPTE